MAGGGTTDNFFEQILAYPTAAAAYAAGTGTTPLMLQLSSTHGGGGIINVEDQASGSGDKLLMKDGGSRTNSYMKSMVVPPRRAQQATTVAGVGRGRVRARRGQATDPHSIAERLRRERIAERIRTLQELVPTINKTDRAVMLDEVLDYVKFLQLQVKVLSISRLGGAADIPILEEQGEMESWSSNNDGTEKQVAKMMEENKIGAAMQFLQSKGLCIMPLLPLNSTTNTSYYRQQQQQQLQNHHHHQH